VNYPSPKGSRFYVLIYKIFDKRNMDKKRTTDFWLNLKKALPDFSSKALFEYF
jgi:hypothetical protein